MENAPSPVSPSHSCVSTSCREAVTRLGDGQEAMDVELSFSCSPPSPRSYSRHCRSSRNNAEAQLTLTFRATFNSRVEDLFSAYRFDHLLAGLRRVFHLEDEDEDVPLIFYTDDYAALHSGQRLRISDQSSLIHAVTAALRHEAAADAQQLIVPITVELSAYAANPDLQSFYEPSALISPHVSRLADLQMKTIQVGQDAIGVAVVAVQRTTNLQAVEEKSVVVDEVAVAFRAGAVVLSPSTALPSPPAVIPHPPPSRPPSASAVRAHAFRVAQQGVDNAVLAVQRANDLIDIEKRTKGLMFESEEFLARGRRVSGEKPSKKPSTWRQLAFGDATWKQLAGDGVIMVSGAGAALFIAFTVIPTGGMSLPLLSAGMAGYHLAIAGGTVAASSLAKNVLPEDMRSKAANAM